MRMKLQTVTYAFGLTMAAMFPLSLQAAEHKISCDTLPAAVQANSKELQKDSVLKSCIKDSTGKKTTYELETLKNGRSRDITFDDHGNMLEVEEQVDESALPAPVAASLQKAAGGGKVSSVESLSRGGSIVGYEAVVIRNGKHREIAFRPDGTPTHAN